MSIKVALSDGIKEFESEITVREIAESIGGCLSGVVVCGKLNGSNLIDLNAKLSADCKLDIITSRDAEYLSVMRHTASHVLAHAVKSLYPTCKLAIGHSISTGFYYDIDFVTPITTADFPKIEKEMKDIIKADFPIERFALAKREANKRMKETGAFYKTELIKAIPTGEEICFYKQGEYVDLCVGPHLASTGKLKAFSLINIIDAYWKDDEKNKMLTRIYGTAFEKKSELDEFLAKLEEAKKRDHNKLGKKLGFFMSDDNVGLGLPLLMPKGAKLMQILTRFVEDEAERRGYALTRTPSIAKSSFLGLSENRDSNDKMSVIGNEEKGDGLFALRHITDVFHFSIFNNGTKSYVDLPVRYAETALVFKNDTSGEMHGLVKTRQSTIANGNILCAPEQAESELTGAINLIYFLLKRLGMENDVSYRLTLVNKKDRKKYFDGELLEKIQNITEEIFADLHISYVEIFGDTAFYGEKLDIIAKNVHGAEDTIITVQLDFAQAERFDMSYIDEKGEKKRPLVISTICCFEKIIAMLIEKYAANFPLWLSPVQAMVIPKTASENELATAFAEKLSGQGIRIKSDIRNGKSDYKIKDAELEKIPYIIVIDENDKENNLICVRRRSKGDLGKMTEQNFIAKIREELDNYIAE